MGLGAIGGLPIIHRALELYSQQKKVEQTIIFELQTAKRRMDFVEINNILVLCFLQPLLVLFR